MVVYIMVRRSTSALKREENKYYVGNIPDSQFKLYQHLYRKTSTEASQRMKIPKAVTNHTVHFESKSTSGVANLWHGHHKWQGEPVPVADHGRDRQLSDM